MIKPDIPENSEIITEKNGVRMKRQKTKGGQNHKKGYFLKGFDMVKE